MRPGEWPLQTRREDALQPRGCAIQDHPNLYLLTPANPSAEHGMNGVCRQDGGRAGAVAAITPACLGKAARRKSYVVTLLRRGNSRRRPLPVVSEFFLLVSKRWTALRRPSRPFQSPTTAAGDLHRQAVAEARGFRLTAALTSRSSTEPQGHLYSFLPMFIFWPLPQTLQSWLLAK